MENNEEEYDVDAVVAEIDAAYAGGKMRRGTLEEAEQIHEAAGRALADLKKKSAKQP
jgi:hypothetical protein